MARVADFVQFSDSSVDLKIGGDIDRTLTRNLDATPASGEGALLTWKVRREGSGSVSYQVFVNKAQNPNPIQTYTVSVGDWVAIQEALSTDEIKFGDNTVDFLVTSGTATLSFGDVILFYRQDT